MKVVSQSVRFPPELHHQIGIAAAIEGLSVNAWIVQLAGREAPKVIERYKKDGN